jgi:hypothetical protein
MKPNHHYSPFRNFEGWEVWLYSGTTRLDRIAGAYQTREQAQKVANKMMREELLNH